jgi:hypothetical protein
MRLHRRITGTVAGLALLAGLGLAGAPSAAAATTPTGTKPLINILLADKDHFDTYWYDFDIVTEAALAVLKAKPNSPVGLLAQGDVALTAFLPNDRAFQVLVYQLTKKWVGNERDVFKAVAGLGIDSVEKVLLYHVVPGATIKASQALKSDGAALTTAEGEKFTVKVLSPYPSFPVVQLADANPSFIDPFLIPSKLDINKGNKQIAHGIAFVLVPKTL